MIWLKKYLEDKFALPVAVSDKSKFGDYASNVLLIHKLNKKEVVDFLLEHPLIDEVQVINGHVNIALHPSLIEYQGLLATKPLRVKGLHDLMFSEGYHNGEIKDEWIELAKKINELNYCLDQYDQSFDLDKTVLAHFYAIDKAYIYRSYSKDYIGGIYRVLHQLLLALGRINHE